MNPLVIRIGLSFVVYLVVYFSLFHAGAGLWALLIIPFGWWEHYDGLTRREVMRRTELWRMAKKSLKEKKWE